jgi:hypothetical protein
MLLIARAIAQFQYPALEGDLGKQWNTKASLGLGWKPNSELAARRDFDFPAAVSHNGDFGCSCPPIQQ